MAKIEGAKHIDAFLVEPEKLLLVTDEKHPLYDPRVLDALDEAFVKNVMFFGVKEPVLIRRVKSCGGEVFEVVAGRQRVKAALEANRRFDEMGEARMRVRCILESGREEDLVAIAVSENEARRDDSVLEKAFKAQRLLDLGKTKSELCTIFCVSAVTINFWLAMNNLSPEVRNDVAAGRISATAAKELAALPGDKQEAMRELMGRADKPVSGKKARAMVKEGAGLPPVEKVKLRPVAEIRHKLDDLEMEIAEAESWEGDGTAFQRLAYTILQWVLGKGEWPRTEDDVPMMEMKGGGDE